MAPVTITYNGIATVGEIVEEPDPEMTVGEYVAAVVDAHPVVGSDFVLQDLVGHDVEFIDPGDAVSVLEGRRLSLVALGPPAAAGALPDDVKTVDDVLAWVDEPDSVDEKLARTRAALDAEHQRAKPRAGVVEPLEAALGEGTLP